MAEAAPTAAAAVAGTLPGSLSLIKNVLLCNLCFTMKTVSNYSEINWPPSSHMLFLKGAQAWDIWLQVFAQIRPVWVGDLITAPKYSKFWCFRLENRHFVIWSAVVDVAKKFKALWATALINFKPAVAEAASAAAAAVASGTPPGLCPWTWMRQIDLISIADPNPSDPYVFGLPGSGSWSFYHPSIINQQ